MRALTRPFALCTLLAVLLAGLLPGAAAADPGWATLNIDAGHRATVAPVFSPNELIAFWFNVPGGAAGAFLSDATGPVSARPDGALDATIAPFDWDRLPLGVDSIVAYGTSSGASAVYVFPQRPNPADFVLRVDHASRRVTSAPIFSRGERIIFWYNYADGNADAFVPTPEGYALAGADGALDLTFSPEQWALISPRATSLVAHGQFSQISIGGVIAR